WFLRHVDINERHPFFFEQKFQHFPEVRFQLTEIRCFFRNADGRAKSDASQPKQGGLLCRSKGAGMPAGAAKVRPKVNSGKNQTHVVPQVSAERDAIGRSAIHAVSLESSGERRSPVTERTRRSNSVAHRGLLDIRSNN